MDELFEVHAAGETSSSVALTDFLRCEFEQSDKKIAVMHKQSSCKFNIQLGSMNQNPNQT